MQQYFFRLILITLALLFFVLPAQAAETYTLDPYHTYVLWRANHFGFSNPSGKWMANGTLVLDEANPQNSEVDVTIRLADETSGIKDLDEHLQGELFFNVKKYPTATFVSNKVEMTGKNTAKVYGTLTMRGVSKPEVLNVKLNKIGISPITNKKTVGFTANTLIKRSDFNITTLLPGVSDEIKIEIEAEATKMAR